MTSPATARSDDSTQHWTHNWAGNIDYSTRDIRAPRTVGELQQVVAEARRVRPLGSRHSFNRLPDTEDTLVFTGLLPLDPVLDPESGTVTVNGGARYGDLVTWLDGQGWALSNLASLPHISIAGAVATGTHGSGVGNQSLNAAVVGLETVTSSGELRTSGSTDEEFAGEVVGLGALGVVSRITLSVVPRFDVAQTVYLDLGWADLLGGYDELAAAAYSVSFFTDFTGDTVAQVWHKALADENPATPPGCRPADGPIHMLAGMDTRAVTEQQGVVGPWFDRLPHFRLEFTPSNGEEIQSEYFVARSDAPAALAALREIGPELSRGLQVAEVRTIAADEQWLSPAYGRDSTAFHFTWRRDPELVGSLLPSVEGALRPFGSRPHWGKVFTMGSDELGTVYPRLADFAALRDRLDPDRKFDNDFLADLLG